MTIDERIERLTERHEALTQTIELLTADVRSLHTDVQGLEAFGRETFTAISELLQAARIAQVQIANHEERISDLES